MCFKKCIYQDSYMNNGGFVMLIMIASDKWPYKEIYSGEHTLGLHRIP